MKFIDGLREEFRSAILLQRPNSLDTAFVLAQLQEEVYDPGKRKELKKPEFPYSAKQNYKPAFPLPAPPSKGDKLQSGAEGKKGADPSRVSSAEEKWQALR